MHTRVLEDLHTKYIKGTSKENMVPVIKVFICQLTVAVSKGILNLRDSSHTKVYVNTRAIKHLYDKKPAEEYDFAINNTHKIIKYPDRVYMNKDTKKGNFLFVKKIKNEHWLCSLEQTYSDTLELITCFRIRKDTYLNNYNLLWSWEGDYLHRNTFDTR